jgi:hypothetical protein
MRSLYVLRVKKEEVAPRPRQNAVKVIITVEVNIHVI